jgi:hypothetical protein
MHGTCIRALLLLLWGAALLAASGCGGKYTTHPVSGRVTDADGAPVAGVMLIWESRAPLISVVAQTDADGRYQLGTLAEADGAPAGEYRIVLAEPQSDDPDAPPLKRVPKRYRDFDSSGLACTVGPGTNTYDIRLDRD